jgi:predicted O-methyltransferase YrrM
MISMTKELSAQIDEVERLAQPRGDAMQVSRAAGELLAAIALAHNAKLIVEVGTSYGFSGLWWSAALARTAGRLHTIDVLEKKYETAKATFKAAGVSDRIVSYLGDARPILANMPANIDIGFIDADKPSSQAYFDLLWPKIRVGGAILTDNVLSHRDEMTDYVTGLKARPDAHSITLPTGSGMEWTVKLK